LDGALFDPALLQAAIDEAGRAYQARSDAGAGAGTGTGTGTAVVGGGVRAEIGSLPPVTSALFQAYSAAEDFDSAFSANSTIHDSDSDDDSYPHSDSKHGSKYDSKSQE
jgi:hypothetical protein